MKTFLAKFNINLPPLPTAPPAHSPNKETLVQIAIVVAVAIMLHFSIASVTIALFSLIAFALKCIIIWRGAKAPSQWLMVLLMIISVGMIIVSYGGWNGQTAGISFLVLLVALKFLESHTVRDYFIVCLILYFLTASSFLFNSSLPSILLVIAYTIAITGLLFKITNPAPVPTLNALKSSSTIILKAIPLALFLFFFFPRVQGNFGFLPSLDKVSNALENSLVAGDLATNAFSDNLAFQAYFDEGIPQMHRLYWRAKVMNEEVNFAWQISRSRQHRKIAEQMQTQAQDPVVGTTYDILHESTSDVFLPYLDYVRNYNKGRINHDYTISLRGGAERGSFSYSGTSALLPSFDTDRLEVAPLTAVSSPPTARIQILINEIRQKHTSPTDRANALFEYFLKNQFSYSLEPPELDEFTPLDDFLFNTKTGYCEHYASAFSTLLRLLEIPARVVVGYHGGRVNTAGNFVEVRYSDAHAWSEAYLDGTWVRYDATGAISPERIKYGMEALRELWDNDLLGNRDNRQALSSFLNPSGSALAWKNISETWSNVQYQWKKWVVDYDFETQKELLAKIGLNAKNSLSTLVFILSGGVFILLSLYFWQLLPKPKKQSELQKIYRVLLKKVKKSGIIANLSNTPNEIAAKITLADPTLEQQAVNIADKYNELSYGRNTLLNAQKLDDLKRDIRRITIKKVRDNKS